MSVKKFGIGQAIRRVEDQRLLTGGGNYTSDYTPERCLESVVLRSPHAHAKFKVTDISAALAIKGVKLIHRRRPDRTRRRAVPGRHAQR